MENPLSVEMATGRKAIAEVLRLRTLVRAGETSPDSKSLSADDPFDVYGEHLVVRDRYSGRTAGACRVLSSEGASRAGGYSMERSFDIAQLEPLRSRMVEVDQACVHPDYRASSVILALWTGVTRYLIDTAHDYLMGCALVRVSDGGHTAASLYRTASEEALSPDDYRVYPRRRLPLEILRASVSSPMPALLKGYLNLGAWVCGEPAVDPHAAYAELPFLLPLARMRGRYARHFLVHAA